MKLSLILQGSTFLRSFGVDCHDLAVKHATKGHLFIEILGSPRILPHQTFDMHLHRPPTSSHEVVAEHSGTREKQFEMTLRSPTAKASPSL